MPRDILLLKKKNSIFSTFIRNKGISDQTCSNFKPIELEQRG